MTVESINSDARVFAAQGRCEVSLFVGWLSRAQHFACSRAWLWSAKPPCPRRSRARKISKRGCAILSVHNTISPTNVPVDNFLRLDDRVFHLEILSLNQSTRVVTEILRPVIQNREIGIHGLDARHSRIGGIRRIIQAIRHLNPAVVHVHHSWSAAIASVGTRIFTKAEVVVTLHHEFNTLRWYQRLCLLFAVACAETIVCNSHSTFRSLGVWRNIWRSTKRFRVRYNGVDARAVTKSRLEKHAMWPSLSTKSFVVGTVARFCQIKDLPTLIRGFALFHKSHPESVLLMIGDGPQRAKLEAMTRDLGIDRSTKFTGCLPKPDVYQWLRMIDVFVVSSRSEGFCNAMAEAMVAERPVVASDIRTLREVAGDGNALFFRCGDSKMVAGHLLRLHSDPSLRLELGARARARAVAEFDVRACAEEYATIYRRLAA